MAANEIPKSNLPRAQRQKFSLETHRPAYVRTDREPKGDSREPHVSIVDLGNLDRMLCFERRPHRKRRERREGGMMG